MSNNDLNNALVKLMTVIDEKDIRENFIEVQKVEAWLSFTCNDLKYWVLHRVSCCLIFSCCKEDSAEIMDWLYYNRSRTS